MPSRLLSRGALALALLAGVVPLHAQSRISEDRDLKELDLSAWDCLNQPGGTAKTPDGVERNTQKNRSPMDLAGVTAAKLDTGGFLRNVSAFDVQTKGKRRKDLNAAERQQLASLEKQVVSLTAYLVIVYAGPPESTNCANVDFHDWHLELFEKPLDHSPGIGDPTPIVCEITPRTQNAMFRDGVRLQKLSGFFRRPDLESEPTGQPAQQVRITGLLMWDDEHNGAADVGTTIQKFAANGYHQPWRSTAWEIHPVLMIEPADGTPSSVPAPPTGLRPAVAAPMPAATSGQQEVTIVEPTKVRISYGETVLPRGMKLPLVSRSAATVSLKYMGQTVVLPLQSTDVR